MPKHKKCYVTIEFPHLTEKQLYHIMKAEEELDRAGIGFDTGYFVPERQREWELDPPSGKMRVVCHEK